MAGAMKVHLRAGDLVYVNGAAIRADRRVTLAIENDAAFLLASYIMAPDAAVTPLHRHYITVQGLLTEPARRDELMGHYAASHCIISAGATTELASSLREIDEAVRDDRLFDALKRLRRLIDAETVMPGLKTSTVAVRDAPATTHASAPAAKPQ